jgi:hypothetical protein
VLPASFAGELSFAGWLLFKGIRSEQWEYADA